MATGCGISYSSTVHITDKILTIINISHKISKVVKCYKLINDSYNCNNNLQNFATYKYWIIIWYVTFADYSSTILLPTLVPWEQIYLTQTMHWLHTFLQSSTRFSFLHVNFRQCLSFFTHPILIFTLISALF